MLRVIIGESHEVINLSYMNDLEDMDVANEATRKMKLPQFLHSSRAASLIASVVKIGQFKSCASILTLTHPLHSLQYTSPSIYTQASADITGKSRLISTNQISPLQGIERPFPPYPDALLNLTLSFFTLLQLR